MLLSSAENEFWFFPFIFALNKPLLLQINTICSPQLCTVWLRDSILLEALGCNVYGNNTTVVSTRQVQGASLKALHAFQWFSDNNL